MHALSLNPTGQPIRRVLAIGAHSDDIEIGCGGTVLRLIEEHPHLEFSWVVLTGSAQRQEEARNSAADFLNGTKHMLHLPGFADGYLPHTGREVKQFFETLKPFAPDLILTHVRHDLHQDHRFANELTWNTFRNHLILEYEIPKYDGDLHTPNVYVQLSEGQARHKVDLLNMHFATQRGKHWFTDEVFLGLMRVRGLECAHAGYAEGFHARKVVV
jgi:LmbE family N-acetylglucosaminyl deacetylase